MIAFDFLSVSRERLVEHSDRGLVKNSILNRLFTVFQRYTENFVFLILGVLELVVYTRIVFEIFVYKHSETIEYVKN